VYNCSINAKSRFDCFHFLLLAYFFTLSADQLHVVLGGYTLRLNNLIACLLLAAVLIRWRTHLFSFPKWLAYSLLGVICTILASWILSPYPARCAFYFGWFILTLLCYVWLPYCMMKLWDPDRIFRIYQISFICVGLYGALQFVLSLVGIYDPFASQIVGEIVRPNAFCFEPSFYALYMTPYVFFYNTRFVLSPVKRSIFALLGVNVLYWISTSTTVFFAYGLFFSLLFFIPAVNYRRLVKLLFSFCLLVGALLVLFPIMFKHFFFKFFYSGWIAHHSFYERWMGIENGWKIFLQNPLFGVGLGGYPCYLMEAFLKGDNSFVFWGDSFRLGEVTNPLKMFEAMNVLTEVLGSLGLFGFCAFSFLFYHFFVRLKRALQIDHAQAYCWLISLCVTLFVLQFNQGLLRTYFWVHLALLAAYLDDLFRKSVRNPG
jgi:hypothetical protein